MTSKETRRKNAWRGLAIPLVVALLLQTLLASLALAEEAWVRKAKKLFENDEYTQVIEIAEPHRKKNIGAMFLAFSHLQEYIFNRTKYDSEKFKNYKHYLEAKMSAEDLDELLYFVNLEDKPEVVKEARKLTKYTFDRIKQIEDVPKLVTFLGSNDEQSRKLALSSIKKILEPKRKVVDSGGTLRTKDIRIMGSSKLITPLLERIEVGDAQRCLLLIQDPVLPYLGKYTGQKYTELEQKIEKAIAKRTEKYPKSNWYSATGKQRE